MMKLSIVLCIFLLLYCYIPALANDRVDSWTPEVAKQLMSEGWEYYQPEHAGPILGYTVHFVEMDERVIENLSFKYDVDLNEQNEEGWKITNWEDALIATAPNFDFALDWLSEGWSTKNQYSSWLLTVNRRPLAVSLTEASVGAKIEDGALLKINLTPVTIDQENQRIETQIQFNFYSRSGAGSYAQLTNWVGAECAEPIAVVTQVIDNAKKQKRYFALYVIGFILSPEVILSDASIISIGDIFGLQQVFYKEDKEETVTVSKMSLGVSCWNDGWGGYLAGLYPIDSKHELTGLLEFGSNLNYEIIARLNLHEGLVFLVKAENEQTGLQPTIYLGVGDEVGLTPNWRIWADLFPLRLNVSEPKTIKDIRLLFGCAYQSDQYLLSYTGSFEDNQLVHSLKGTASINDQFSFEIDYKYSGTKRHCIRLGFCFCIF